MTKLIQKTLCLLVVLFCFITNANAQTTETFATSPTLTSSPGFEGVWTNIATLTIGGMSFTLHQTGNDSWHHVSNGGNGGSSSLRYDGGGSGLITIKKTDGTRFKFYGLWLNYTTMSVYPTRTLKIEGKRGGVVQFTDNYGSGGQVTSVKDVEVNEVVLTIEGLDRIYLDDLIVGPTASVVVPTVTTTAQTNVGAVSATLGGNVTSNGGGTVTERGIVWATTANPTTSNNKITNGSGTGSFSGTITGLPSATLIYYRAYAINSAGTAYGSSTTFTTNNALNTSTIRTDIACFGGSSGVASVIPSGGKTPYTYLWNTSATSSSITNLSAGTYSVVITDAEGTTVSRSFTINQPAAALSLATGGGKTDVSCFGGANGTATVAPTGGTPAYTYSWSPSGGTAATATGLGVGVYTVTVTDANGCQATRSFTINQPASALSLATGGGKTDVSCFGGANGTATVAPTGGTPAYTYSWSPSGGTAATATGLVAGVYTVTVTDANGCQATRSFTINQPASALSLATGGSQTNILCNGSLTGTATVAPTGGTPGYTYSWSPSGGTAATATGLAAGIYTVTVTDANGCQATRSFTITQPSALVASFGAQTNVSCNGGTNGSATVSVAGGTAGYTYSWAPSGGTAATASGLAAGIYTVTVTDANGCQATQSFTITQPSALVASFGAQTNVSCNGGTNGSATVSVAGGTAGYTYSWAPSGGTAATASGLAAGTYTVTVTDANGCQATQSFTITQPSALVASFGAQTNVSCNGGTNGSATVSVAGGTAGYTYSWAPSGGTAATASGLAVGTYTVTVTDANGCQATQSFIITQPSALVASFGAQTNVSCNGGTNGSATVSVAGGTAGYTYSWAPSGGTAATASGLAAGTYTVTVTDANGCQATQSFTITQPATVAITTTSLTDATVAASYNQSLTTTGGSGAYTYAVTSGSLPDGLTLSSAGVLSGTPTTAGTLTFTITATETGCSQTNSKSFTFTTNKGNQTLTFNSLSNKTYGDVSFTLGGISSSGLPVTYTSSNTAVASISGNTVTITGAGQTTITAKQAGNGNYNAAADVAQTLTIDKKSITLSLNATPLITKSYDGSTNASLVAANYTLNGLVGADAVTVTGTASYDNKNIGIGKTITVNTFVLDGARKDHYTLTTTTATVTGNISPKPITLSLNAAPLISKVYDGNTNVTLASGNYSLSGVETGDIVTVSGNGNYNNRNAGAGKTITVNTFVLDGAQKNNYTLTTTSATTTGNITTKPITLSLNTTPLITKVYNGNDEIDLVYDNYTLSGVLDFDNVDVSGKGIYADKNVGNNKPITFGSFALFGTHANNYQLTTTTANTLGTITAKPITVSLNASPLLTKVYDGTTSIVLTSGNYTFQQVVPGDLLTLNSTANFDNANAGNNKTITVSNFTLTGENRNNYMLSTSPVSTTGSISPKPVTLSLNSSSTISKVYDGNTQVSLVPANYQLTGVVGTDNLTASADASYADKNVGNNKAITINNFALTGSAAGNYSLANSSITAATGNITQKALTITANNQERFYNQANPVFTASYTGFVTGEDNSILTTQPVLSTTASLTSLPGNYVININGASAANYAITHVNGTLTIKQSLPKTLTLSSNTILENKGIGTLVGTLTATSDDPSNTFTYALVGGVGSTDNISFTVSGGQLFTGREFDFETKNSYSILVRATNQFGVSIDQQFTITVVDVNEAPTIAAVANQTLCSTINQQTIPLSGINAGPEQNQTTTVTISSNNAALFSALSIVNNSVVYKLAEGAAGVATLTLTVKDNGGTANGGVDTYTTTFTLTANALPSAPIVSSVGTKIAQGESAVLTASGGTSYVWTNSDGIVSGQNTSTLTIKPSVTTTYSVTITNASGCSSTQSITITVTSLDQLAKIEATNIMSPNGDGVNDLWIVKDIESYPNNIVKIFDVAGRIVFSQRSYKNTWDATLRGVPLNEGTYYYVIDFGGDGKTVKNGYITIIRK